MSGEDSFFQPDQTGSSLAEDDFAQQNGGTEEEAQMSSSGISGGGGAFNPVSTATTPPTFALCLCLPYELIYSSAGLRRSLLPADLH